MNGHLLCKDPADLGVQPWQFVTVVLYECGCPCGWSTDRERLPPGETVTMPASAVVAAFDATAEAHLVQHPSGQVGLSPTCRRATL